MCSSIFILNIDYNSIIWYDAYYIVCSYLYYIGDANAGQITDEILAEEGEDEANEAEMMGDDDDNENENEIEEDDDDDDDG